MSSPFRPVPSESVAPAGLQNRGVQDLFLAAIVAATSFSACLAAAFIAAIVVISG